MAQAETIQSTFNGAGNGAAIGGQTGGGYGALIGGIVGAAGGLASGIMGSNAEEEAYKRRKKAYESMLKRAADIQTEGEGAFNNLVANPNSYLGVMQRQLNDNTNKDLNMGRNQLNLALAQQGLRGGQAATQLNRGIGNMTTQANQDLNNMMYDEEQQRRNLQAAYNQAKALAGINASLQEFQG